MADKTERSATAKEIQEWNEENDEPHPVFQVHHRPERIRVGGLDWVLKHRLIESEGWSNE